MEYNRFRVQDKLFDLKSIDYLYTVTFDNEYDDNYRNSILNKIYESDDEIGIICNAP